jgi:hypothetical protein
MNDTAASRTLGYGPWAPGIDRVECRLQMRGMSVTAYMLLGPHHPLWRTLRDGETDPTAFVRAQELVEALPSLWRRRLLATHMAITWPRRRPGGAP